MERSVRERRYTGALTWPKGPGPRCLHVFTGKAERGEGQPSRPAWGSVYSHWCCTACTADRPRYRRWLQTGRAARSSELPWGPPCRGCCWFLGCGRDWKLQESLGHGSKAAGRRRLRRSAVQNEGHCHSGTKAHAGGPGGPAGCSRG